MKLLKRMIITGSILGLTHITCVAEGKGGGNGFIDTAKKYEEKSRKAHIAGNLEDAVIYHQLGQIKRAAAKASANGEDFSWDEYHALQGKLTGNQKGKKGHDKKGKHGKKGGGFNEAAERYERLSAKARANENEADAKIYDRLAQIKRDASAHKGDKPFDWSEYHKLNGQLSGKGKHKGHKGHKKHHKDGKKDGKKGAKKGGNGFLKAAEEYTAKANEAMQNGNEDKARIYTRLAGMKREAAAAAERGEGYDWTEYFKLQKELK